MEPATGVQKRPPTRRRLDPEVTEAVLDAKGPSEALKILWLQLWSYRSQLDQIRDRTQAELAALLGIKERWLRWSLEQARHYGMLSDHRGVRGKPSLYTLHPPHHWLTEPHEARVAFLPPKRRREGAARRPGPPAGAPGPGGEAATAEATCEAPTSSKLAEEALAG
jgi:hypothetical protein